MRRLPSMHTKKTFFLCVVNHMRILNTDNLSIMFKRKLILGTQVAKSSCKGPIMLGFVMWYSFNFKNRLAFRVLKYTVWSILKAGYIAWNPSKSKCFLLKTIQCKFFDCSLQGEVWNATIHLYFDLIVCSFWYNFST